MSNLTASYEYSGMPDYWGGNGRRWDRDAGCLFAYYNGSTTLRDIVDQLVDDYGNNGEHEDDCWESIDSEDVRQAILDMLTAQGRADYNSGALSEWAVDYAKINAYDGELVVGESVMIDNCFNLTGNEYAIGTIAKISESSVFVDIDGKTLRRDFDDVYPLVDEDDCCESPMVVVMLELEVCPDCDNPSGDNTYDGLCDKCQRIHYG